MSTVAEEQRIGLWRDDRLLLQLLIGTVCVFITASIGWTYGRAVWVAGWQLWAWASAVLVLVVGLLPAERIPLRKDIVAKWLPVLFLLALLLRAPALARIPGGLHVDESGVASFAIWHVFPHANETVNPFRTGPSSQPALHHYILRLSMKLAGETIWGLRISSAIIGSFAVLTTYAVVMQLQNQRVALLAAILMAGYHYHLHWSRIALNNIWDTFWVPAMLAAFVWGWKHRWSGGAVLSGLALGLSQYFYAGSKVGIILLAFTVLWLFWQERDRQRLLVHGTKLLVTAFCTAAPIFLYILRDPEPYMQRPREVFGWQEGYILEVMGGRYDLVGYAWHQISRSFGAFNFFPDVTGFYGPGVPLLIGVAGPLFLIGVVWAVRVRQYVPLLWILLTVVLGGILIGGAPSSSHFVVSIPAICWLVAIPLDQLMKQGNRRLALLLLAGIVATDLIFYFFFYVPGIPRDLILPFPET